MNYFDLEQETLSTFKKSGAKIDDKVENNSSRCFICNKPFSHIKILRPSNEVEGLREFEIITSHPTCSNLLLRKKRLEDKVKELKSQIDSIDFKLIYKTI
jgi:hypothetical protein